MVEIRTVSETRSTNDDVATLARDGAAEGLWLRAERQTGGRGRQGRAWQSPVGNLYASTLVRVRQGDPPAPTLALVSAVALHEVVASFTRQMGETRLPTATAPQVVASGAHRNEVVQIKWPNDILASGAKLSGILLERAGDAVVIGFGVNLSHHPENLDRPATSLATLTGVAPDPAIFLEMLAESFARWLQRWQTQGLAPIRLHWCAAAHPIGTALSTPEGEGLFDGLDEEGALRLKLADGSVQIVHAGDVFLI